MNIPAILFWSLFTVAGIWLQGAIPGVDFLAPGLVLCLQEEKWTVSAWLGLAWLFIQEGTGSLAFGTGLLWYGALVGLYYFGHWLFEAKNFLFMFILGISLGVLHLVLSHVMAVLQDWTLPADRVLVEGLLQALIFPVEWGLIYLIYNHLPENSHAV